MLLLLVDIFVIFCKKSFFAFFDAAGNELGWISTSTNQKKRVIRVMSIEPQAYHTPNRQGASSTDQPGKRIVDTSR